jgi:hypothetical protein
MTGPVFARVKVPTHDGKVFFQIIAPKTIHFWKVFCEQTVSDPHPQSVFFFFGLLM